MLIIGHRGAAGLAPENTMAAIAAGIEAGSDMIEIDVPARSIHLEIDNEEMAKRQAAFHWEFPGNDYPKYLNLFVKNVGSMAKGGIWE